jgi:hypothetical protein
MGRWSNPKTYPTCQVWNTFQGSNIILQLYDLGNIFGLRRAPDYPSPGPDPVPISLVFELQQNINITPFSSPAFRAWPITTSRTREPLGNILKEKEKKREKEKTAVLPILGMLLILLYSTSIPQF